MKVDDIILYNIEALRSGKIRQGPSLFRESIKGPISWAFHKKFGLDTSIRWGEFTDDELADLYEIVFIYKGLVA